jgi:hypothetical protein
MICNNVEDVCFLAHSSGNMEAGVAGKKINIDKYFETEGVLKN